MDVKRNLPDPKVCETRKYSDLDIYFCLVQNSDICFYRIKLDYRFLCNHPNHSRMTQPPPRQD
jgi:hypothetical protein